jgi:uncharacterized membrane protein YbhN (UPF0104 family)
MRGGVRWLRPLTGAALLGVLLWQVGASPVLDALGRVDGWTLAAATGITAATTLCCAWRWSLVARALGIAVPLRASVVECYRSQFLNVTMPGGVLGDVNRGIRHGRGSGDIGRGLRSVVWERLAGQVVLVLLALTAWLAVPSPARAALPLPTVAVAGMFVGVALVALRGRRGLRGRRRVAGALRVVVEDARSGLLGRRTVLGVVGTSGLAVAGNLALFVVAARTAHTTAPATQLVPLGLLVLLAMGLPLGLAGWGPREGAAAWAFGASGLGVEQGVAVAVVYGVMVLVASLPGAALMVATQLRPGDAGPAGQGPRPCFDRVGSRADEAGHG